MKVPTPLLLSGLLICGCSRNNPVTHPKVELIEPGKDITSFKGYTLHVDKREGNSIEGVQIVKFSPDGNDLFLSASNATIVATSDPKTVHLVLIGVTSKKQSQSKVITQKVGRMELVLEE